MAKGRKSYCRHKKIKLLAMQITPNTFTGIGHVCKECGAVRNSVNLGAKWKKGSTEALCEELIQVFGYQGHPHRFI
jgi:hypothetical protein